MAAHPFPWTDAFLAALRTMPVLRYACQAVGIDAATAWRRRKADPDFDEAVLAAMEEGMDKAEQEAYRRGVDGFEEPLTHQGRITWQLEYYDRETGEAVPDDVYEANMLKSPDNRKSLGWRYLKDAAGQRVPVTVRKHSDTLLQFVLRGRRRAVFGDKQEITGAGGGPLQIDETARAARLAQLMALAKARKQDDIVVPEDFDLA